MSRARQQHAIVLARYFNGEEVAGGRTTHLVTSVRGLAIVLVRLGPPTLDSHWGYRIECSRATAVALGGHQILASERGHWVVNSVDRTYRIELWITNMEREKS